MAGAVRATRKTRPQKVLVLAAGFALATCAGRDPHPVAVVQPQDAQSDCAMIGAEIEANNVQAEKLADENHAKIAQNVAAGVVGVVVWPVWFAMDAKGAAGTEMDALKARQQSSRRWRSSGVRVRRVRRRFISRRGNRCGALHEPAHSRSPA